MKEEHPLNILVAQTDTSKQGQNTNTENRNINPSEKVYAQKAIRTFEGDVAKKMYEGKANGKLFNKKELKRIEEERRIENLKMEELRKRDEKLKIEEMKRVREEEERRIELLKNTEVARKEQVAKMQQSESVNEIEAAKKEALEKEAEIARNFEQKRREDAMVEESLARKAEIEAKEAEIKNREEELRKAIKNNIRTYEGDVATAVKENKASRSSMYLAEAKKREEEKIRLGTSKYGADGSGGKNIAKKAFLSLAGIIFIAGGAFGGYYFYKKSPFAKPPVLDSKPAIMSIVSPDSQTILPIDNLSQKDILSAITNSLNNKNGVGKINELVPTLKSGEITQYITGPDFMKRLGVDLPNPLSRSLANKMMLGSVKDDSGRSRVFIILTTNFFQNSYAGMLSFEKDMPNELEYIMNYKSIVDEINSTASTSINNYFGIRGSYVDRQVKNRDVREFIHESGNIFFVYSFVDKNTLVITESESALSKIIEKIEKQSYIR